MKVEWQKLDWVEVQVFKSETPSGHAILFCPGYPGLGGAMFEQRHASALTHEGYDLYVIHHKGTRTGGAMAPASINNGKRVQDAWENNENHIGGGAVTGEELLNEPSIALKAIADKYEAIHIIGNSFGALSSLWSLTSDGAPIDKVKSLVLLAGAQGINDGTDECVMRLWKPEFMAQPRYTEQFEVKDIPGAIVTIKKAYDELPKRVMEKLPAHVKLTYVVIEKDEILRLSDTLAFQKAIEGRGEIIIDKEEQGFPAYMIGAHYTPNYKTRDLLKVIRG